MRARQNVFTSAAHRLVSLFPAIRLKLPPAPTHAEGFFNKLRGTGCTPDNLCKVAKSKDDREVGAFLTWLDGFSSPLNIKFTITISADPEAGRSPSLQLHHTTSTAI